MLKSEEIIRLLQKKHTHCYVAFFPTETPFQQLKEKKHYFFIPTNKKAKEVGV